MEKKKKNRDYRSRKKDMRAIPQKISRALDVPIETFHNISRVEVMGNREMMIEGIEKVTEYDENVIVLDGKKNQIKVFGNNLFIQNFAEDSVSVTGSIQSVEFIVK